MHPTAVLHIWICLVLSRVGLLIPQISGSLSPLTCALGWPHTSAAAPAEPQSRPQDLTLVTKDDAEPCRLSAFPFLSSPPLPFLSGSAQARLAARLPVGRESRCPAGFLANKRGGAGQRAAAAVSSWRAEQITVHLTSPWIKLGTDPRVQTRIRWYTSRLFFFFSSFSIPVTDDRQNMWLCKSIRRSYGGHSSYPNSH